jgi:type I restriction enzyme M protein
MGFLVDRTLRDLSDEEIGQISRTYHVWRVGNGEYEDIPGFCKSATLDEIAGHGYVLTPGRYVGAADVEDDGEPFEEKMARLTTTLHEQFAENARLEAIIRQNLRKLGYEV